MKIYICPKCNRKVGSSMRCTDCGVWMLESFVPDSIQKQAHEQTYYALEKQYGKKVADKLWKK